MAKKQKFTCKEAGCKKVIVFDPEENILTSLNESFSFNNKTKEKVKKTVTAYLTCSNNHTHPYKVTKTYES